MENYLVSEGRYPYIICWIIVLIVFVALIAICFFWGRAKYREIFRHNKDKKQSLEQQRRAKKMSLMFHNAAILAVSFVFLWMVGMILIVTDGEIKDDELALIILLFLASCISLFGLQMPKPKKKKQTSSKKSSSLKSRKKLS